MTPEQAAANAAKTLDDARDHYQSPETVAALVQIADAWTRLSATLASAPVPLDPPATVNVDTLTVAEPEPLCLPKENARSPVVKIWGKRYEVRCWDFRLGNSIDYANLWLSLIPIDR